MFHLPPAIFLKLHDLDSYRSAGIGMKLRVFESQRGQFVSERW